MLEGICTGIQAGFNQLLVKLGMRSVIVNIRDTAVLLPASEGCFIFRLNGEAHIVLPKEKSPGSDIVRMHIAMTSALFHPKNNDLFMALADRVKESANSSVESKSPMTDTDPSTHTEEKAPGQ